MPYTTENMGRLTLHKRELSRLACRTEKMDRLVLQNREHGRGGPAEQRIWTGWSYATENISRLTLHKREN